MAESTGKDMPASDPKPTASRTGPVKPPVLEGTARSSTRPDDATTASKEASGPAARAAAPAPAGEDTGSAGAWLAGLIGGALGLGAAYGLAWFGLWPSPPPPAVPTDPRLAQFAAAIPELEAVAGTVQDNLLTLTQRVAALETTSAQPSEPAPGPTDAVTADQLAALSARLDELAAAGRGGTDTETLAALETELADLRAEVEGALDQLAETEQQLAAMSQSAQDAAGADAAAIRLPLIFSGLESAFDSGRPFEAELAALRRAMPDVIVPEALAAGAANGLPRPETVANQLNMALPDMLAGRPASEGANWQDAAAGWFRGLVAMRPADAVEGDSPDAVVARLEAAVDRRDFLAAETELAALPDSMRRAADAFAADIASLAAAQAFLGQLRARALVETPGSGA